MDTGGGSKSWALWHDAEPESGGSGFGPLRAQGNGATLLGRSQEHVDRNGLLSCRVRDGSFRTFVFSLFLLLLFSFSDHFNFLSLT